MLNVTCTKYIKNERKRIASVTAVNMECVEQKPYPPWAPTHLLEMYVDDTSTALWVATIDGYYRHLNYIVPFIQLTVNVEDNDLLPFWMP